MMIPKSPLGHEGTTHDLFWLCWRLKGPRSGQPKASPESAEKSLAEGNVRSPRKDGMTIQWLKYIYIKDEYEKLTKEQYRDFIELSSPLDYMGDS